MRASVPGDHVALSWAPSCGECAECLRDLPQLCSTAWPAMAAGGLLDGTTRLSRGGEPLYHYSFLSSFAEACVVPARCCVAIDRRRAARDRRRSSAARSRPGVGAVWRTAGVRPGDRVAVLGCGGVGLSAVLGAAAAGAGSIVAVDVSAGKLAVAEDVGATGGVLWAGTAAETAAAVVEASGGGVDYAFEATGRTEAMQAAFLSTRARGAAVLIGIPRDDALLSAARDHDPAAWSGACSARSTARRGPSATSGSILDLYRRGRLPLDKLVSHRLPLDEVEHGFELHAPGERAARRPRPRSGSRRVTPQELDGRIAEGWGGVKPNGSHVNVVLAARGTPTAAAALSMLAHPSPGHTPVLVCVGPRRRPATSRSGRRR